MKLTRKHGIAIGAIALVIVCIAAVAYWRWTKSPSYSLRQVQKSIETHDLMKFEKYVDLDSVIARFVDQIIEEKVSNKETNSSAEALGANFAQGLIQVMKPQMQTAIAEQVKAMVERGADSVSDDEEESGMNLTTFLKKDDASLDFRGFDDTKKDGKIAIVTLAFYQKHTNDEAMLNVKMRQMDGYWQVAELPDASSFIDKVNAIREKILAEKNKPIIEQMKKVLIVTNTNKYTHSDTWGFQKNSLFDVGIKNIGDKDIKAYYGVISVKDSDGTLIKAFGVKDEDGIAAGKETTGTWSIDANQFIEEESRIYETSNENLKVEMQIGRILFSDGSEIKLFE